MRSREVMSHLQMISGKSDSKSDIRKEVFADLCEVKVTIEGSER